MTQLIPLIDPNDDNLEALINEVNELKPDNVWVGCSTSSGDEVINVLANLDVNASLYPGTFDQIREAGPLAEKIYLPDPAIYSKPEIKKIFDEVSMYSVGKFQDRVEFMNYVLLHPNSSAAKVLGMTITPTDDEVIDVLSNTKVHDLIYLEGGSRNKDSPVNTRLDLVKKLNLLYPDSSIICGGGISKVDQAKELKDHCSYVVVSSALHKDPKSLETYMKALEHELTLL